MDSLTLARMIEDAEAELSGEMTRPGFR
jgi:hypothetical protein